MTVARILSRVGLPAPFPPTRPQDSPGFARNWISRSTHRHETLFLLRMRSYACPSWSWRYVGRLSLRKRFQTSDVLIVPSRNVGEPRFEPLEDRESAKKEERRRCRADE